MDFRTDLTDMQRHALYYVGFGVRKYADGYFSEDEPDVRIDGRSLNALDRMGLVYWRSIGGTPQYISLRLTVAGEELFEQMRDAGYDPSKKRWS